MRKISNLIKTNCRVYLIVTSEEFDKKLRRQAESEGIKIEDNSDLYVLRENRVLKAVGFIDHLCFHSGTKTMGDDTPIVRVDAGKYLCGDNFLF
ncbi:MAG: hypothetical protein J1E41_03985 [Ruminococcus sp.]|nr:hypothetical protein [Ruminococcus sp.]